MDRGYYFSANISYRAARRAFQLVIESEGGGFAIAQYWLLLLHLKKKDIPAAQVGHCLNTDV